MVVHNDDNSARRWAAVVRRDAAFDGTFVYCVKSTSIYCRPTCKARLARRTNVTFCDTASQAEALGFRACKRCQPSLAEWNPEKDKIRKVCEFLDGLDADAPVPGLERLAGVAGLTKHHFHRLFKREVGLTPREYALQSRSRKGAMSETPASEELTSPITPFTNESEAPVMVGGGNGDDIDWSSLVDDRDLYGFDLIGFTLDDNAAKDMAIDQVELLVVHYSIADTMFGKLLVAFQDEKVCKLELGNSELELMASLETAFPSMYYLHTDIVLANQAVAVAYQQRIDAVVNALEYPSGKMVDVPSSLTPGKMPCVLPQIAPTDNTRGC